MALLSILLSLKAWRHMNFIYLFIGEYLSNRQFTLAFLHKYLLTGHSMDRKSSVQTNHKSGLSIYYCLDNYGQNLCLAILFQPIFSYLLNLLLFISFAEGCFQVFSFLFLSYLFHILCYFYITWSFFKPS